MGSPSAALAREEARPLRHALQRWLAQPEQDREAEYLYYALDHEYTEANISHRGLKTRDLAVVDVLHQLSVTMPFHIFLAALEKSERGSCEYKHNAAYGRGRWGYYDDQEEDDEDEDQGFHDVEEVFDTEYNIKKLVDLGGRQLGVDTSFDLDYVLQEDDDLFPEHPDGEDYEGYMGNSGPSATHWYRASAVVIVPQDHLVPYLSSASRFSSVSSVTEYIADICLGLMESDRSSALQMWSAFHDGIFKQRGGMTKVTPDTKGLVLLTTLRMRDWRLWNDIIASMATEKHDLPDIFFFDVCEEVLMDEVSFDQITEGMSTLVTLLPTLARQYEVISSFTHLDSHEDIDIKDDLRTLAEAWARQAFTRVLTEDRPLGANDGRSMVDIAFERFDFTFFRDVTVPIFHTRIEDFGFSIEYLNQFRVYIGADDNEKPNRDEWRTLHRSLATSLIDVIDASLLRTREGLAARAAATVYPRSGYAYGIRLQRGDPTILREDLRNTVTSDVLTDFTHGVLVSDLPLPTVQKLFFKLTDRAGRIDATEFHELWLPFLRGFVSVLEECSIPLTTPRYQHFCAAVLEAYIENYVRKEPTATSSLAQPAVNCHCGGCSRLNAFLVNPHQETVRFPVGKQRRQHLHQKLDNAGIDCTHETERYGNPQTLVVTKTFTKQVKAQAAWKARAEAAKKQFELFDQGQLQILLGQDFLKITELKDVRAGSNQQATPAQQQPRHQTQPNTQRTSDVRPGQSVTPRQWGPRQCGLPRQYARSAFQPSQVALRGSTSQPYQSPYTQHGFSAPQPPPSQSRAPAQPAVQPRKPPGIEEIGILPASNQSQPVSRSSLGAMSPVSGNQTHRRSGLFPKVESPDVQMLGIKQEGGKKRKASEIEPDIIDLTGDD